MKRILTFPKSAGQRRGTTAVEFAAVAPVFFVFVFGLLEFGRVMMIQQALTVSAREGCRTAALATTVDANTVKASAQRFVNGVVSDPSRVRFTVPSVAPNTAPGSPLTVRVEVDYADVSWLPLMGRNPKLAAEATHLRE